MSKMRVEVAYALPECQEIIALEVEAGSTVRQAIEQSGILRRFPEIDLTRQKVGVFSKRRDLNDILEPGDRVEIYRPLTIDPKDLRRVRARKK
ncbi:MAG TPA: RnfH family protein [Gammaproteobacteria bacterium]|nr:RnfH family protein [Gammaproteobacteria bacterium]